MKRRTYCVYNQTRECFISLGVTPADTTFARLRGLIGRLELKFDAGMQPLVRTLIDERPV